MSFDGQKRNFLFGKKVKKIKPGKMSTDNGNFCHAQKRKKTIKKWGRGDYPTRDVYITPRNK
jgi:hypothetical protein